MVHACVGGRGRGRDAEDSQALPARLERTCAEVQDGSKWESDTCWTRFGRPRGSPTPAHIAFPPCAWPPPRQALRHAAPHLVRQQQRAQLRGGRELGGGAPAAGEALDHGHVRREALDRVQSEPLPAAGGAEEARHLGGGAAQRAARERGGGGLREQLLRGLKGLLRGEFGGWWWAWGRGAQVSLMGRGWWVCVCGEVRRSPLGGNVRSPVLAPLCKGVG